MSIVVDYESIFEECKDLLRSKDIPIEVDDKISISFNLSTSNQAEAYCSINNNCYELELKRAYIIHKNADIKHLKNVIMHELVHTVPGCTIGIVASKHSELFKEYAKKINKLLGYNILEFEELSSYMYGNLDIKIKAECSACGCSRIFRTQKSIDKDIFARSCFIYGTYTDFCPYCETHTMIYRKIEE